MTLSVSAVSVLDPETCSRVVPAERLFWTCDDAGSALQAPIRGQMYVTFWPERVHLRRADKEAILWLALHAADFMVYLDVYFFVDFEDVSSEFVFHPQDCVPLYLEQLKGIFQG